jgi:4-oxalocrotonate tautomerase
MPHVIVKLWPGESEKQKAQLAEAITKNILDLGDESISVAIEEVAPQQWAEKVYKPDIESKPEQLYKKPGYDVSDLP